MKTEDIKNIGLAYKQVQEAAMTKKQMARTAAKGVSMAKPKDQVSLPKAPWDKKNEQFVIPEDIPTDERTAFHGAAAGAHKAGKSHFSFQGKKYPVTMKKDTANAIADDVKKEEMDKTKPCPKCDGSMENHAADCPMAEGSKGNDKEVAVANPKQEKKMAAEGTVYARILEKRDMHMKGATKPEEMDDKYTGKGAKDMKKDHEPDINDTEEKGHQDAVSAGRAGPNAKARPNDNMKGDKSVINPPKEAK